MSKEYCELCIGQMEKSYLLVIDVDGREVYICNDCKQKIDVAPYAEDVDESETPHA